MEPSEMKKKLIGSVAAMRVMIVHKKRLEKLIETREHEFDNLKEIEDILLQIVLEAHCQGFDSALDRIQHANLNIRLEGPPTLSECVPDQPL